MFDYAIFNRARLIFSLYALLNVGDLWNCARSLCPEMVKPGAVFIGRFIRADRNLGSFISLVQGRFPNSACIFLPGRSISGQEWLTLWRTIKTIRDESEKNRCSLLGIDGGRLAAGQSPTGFRFRQRYGFAAAMRGASLGLGRAGSRGCGDRVVGRIDCPDPLRSGREVDAEAENS